MSKQSLARVVPEPPSLTDWDTADLRTELARGLTMTAEGLARMGLIWQELERRGEDLSDLKRGIATYLPSIASGQLAAEAVVAFASRRSLLRALEGVPLGEQRRLAAGGTVPVIDPTDPDTVTEVAPASVPPAALRLVFADGEVRTPALQRIALRSRQPKRGIGDTERRFRPRFDADAGTITIGRMTVRLSDLLAELAANSGPDRPPVVEATDEYLHVKVRLTRPEYERYAALCRSVGLPDWEMGRKALRAFGLI